MREYLYVRTPADYNNKVFLSIFHLLHFYILFVCIFFLLLLFAKQLPLFAIRFYQLV